jgi:hypothetical protein
MTKSAVFAKGKNGDKSLKHHTKRYQEVKDSNPT